MHSPGPETRRSAPKPRGSRCGRSSSLGTGPCLQGGVKGHVRFDRQTNGEKNGPGAPTEEVVAGQGVQDPRGPDQVAHGGREGGGIDADGDKMAPDVDVSEEAVVSLEEDAVGSKTGWVFLTPKGLYNLVTGKVVFFFFLQTRKRKKESFSYTHNPSFRLVSVSASCFEPHPPLVYSRRLYFSFN